MLAQDVTDDPFVPQIRLLVDAIAGRSIDGGLLAQTRQRALELAAGS